MVFYFVKGFLNQENFIQNYLLILIIFVADDEIVRFNGGIFRYDKS